MRNARRRWLLLSPAALQAMAIARCLHRGEYPVHVTGGLLPGQLRPPGSAGFDAMRRIDRIETLREFDVILPTTAMCTHFLSEALGDFSVGDVVFAAANLRCFDKLAILRRAVTLGIPTPSTWCSYAAVPADAGTIFFKPALEGVDG